MSGQPQDTDQGFESFSEETKIEIMHAIKVSFDKNIKAKPIELFLGSTAVIQGETEFLKEVRSSLDELFK